MDTEKLEKAKAWVEKLRLANRKAYQKRHGDNIRPMTVVDKTTDEEILKRYTEQFNKHRDNDKIRYLNKKDALKEKYNNNKDDMLTKMKGYYQKNKEQLLEKARERRLQAGKTTIRGRPKKAHNVDHEPVVIAV